MKGVKQMYKLTIYVSSYEKVNGEYAMVEVKKSFTCGWSVLQTMIECMVASSDSKLKFEIEREEKCEN